MCGRDLGRSRGRLSRSRDHEMQSLAGSRTDTPALQCEQALPANLIVVRVTGVALFAILIDVVRVPAGPSHDVAVASAADD